MTAEKLPSSLGIFAKDQKVMIEEGCRRHMYSEQAIPERRTALAYMYIHVCT